MESTSEVDVERRTQPYQQEVVAELGRQSLEHDDLDRVLQDATAAVADVLDIEYVAFLEAIPTEDELRLRGSVGWTEDALGTSIDVSALGARALESLEEEDAPFVVGFDDAEHTSALDAGRDLTGRLCAIVGSHAEPWGLLGAFTTDQREFSRQDRAFVQSVANVIATTVRTERSRHELEEVYGRISDAFFGLDEQWRFTHLNERAEALINHDGRDLVGANIWDEFPAASMREFKPAYERAMLEQTTVTFEEYYPDPLDAWFEVRAYPSETGLSVYFRDVTERKARELALEQSERRYRTLAEEFPNGIVTLFDDRLTYTLAAGRAFDRLSVSADSIEGRTPREVWGPTTGNRLEAAMQSALEGTERRIELSYADRDWIVHAVPVTDEAGRVFAGMAMAQDVTDRIAQRRELRRRARQQRVVANLGRFALETDDLNDLLDEATRVVADTLDATHCKVLSLDDDPNELLLWQGVGWREGCVGTGTVDAGEDSQAGYTLLSKEPVVVDDLEADDRFDGPELLTSHGITSGISTIIGSLESPWGILGVHDTARRSFSAEDVAFVRAVAVVLAEAIERHRGHLVALSQLNGVVQTITDAVIDRSSRDEIYRVLCDVLASHDVYEFAWVAEVDPDDGVFRPQTAAGVDTPPESIDADRLGPVTDALQAQEMRVTNDVFDDPRYESCREHAREHGYHSVAGIPLRYENTLYGVLGVYATFADAFTEEKAAVIGQLGEIVGHAITAVERERALLNDEVVELDLLIPGISDVPDGSGKITFDRSIRVSNTERRVYGTAPVELADTYEEASRQLIDAESVHVIGETNDFVRFEISVREDPLVMKITSLGGAVDAAYLEDGDFHLRLHLPRGTDVKRVVDLVRAEHPRARTLAHRQVQRSEHGSTPSLEPPVIDSLTDRQRTAFETAFYAGYFNWPRDNTGEEIAARLDVSPATFHEHLRTAQKRLFESLLEDESPDR